MEDFSLPFSNLNTAECKNIVYVVKKIWRQKITNGGPYISCCSNKKVIKIHAVTWEVTCAWFPFTGKTIAFSFYGDNTWNSRVYRNLSFVIFNIIFFYPNPSSYKHIVIKLVTFMLIRVFDITFKNMFTMIKSMKKHLVTVQKYNSGILAKLKEKILSWCLFTLEK